MSKQTKKPNFKSEKVKSQYRSEAISQYGNVSYPNLRSQSHKKFSTTQESALYSQHMAEHRKDGIVKLRAKRSNKNIANPNDDYATNLYSLRSWKDKTKRKTQYYK